MREPFNTTCDLYTGNAAAFPGVFIGNFPCRFVVEDGIFSVGPGCPDIVAYLTIDAYQPRGFWKAPFLQIDPNLSDVVHVLSLPGEEFYVVYSDRIQWRSQPQYFRAYLARFPIPPIAISGGVLLAGEAIIYFVRRLLGTGGLLAGGAAAVSAERVITAGAGGLLAGGAAAVSFTPGPPTIRIDDSFQRSGSINATQPDVSNIPGNNWAVTIGGITANFGHADPTTYSGFLARAIIDNNQRCTDVTATGMILPSGNIWKEFYVFFRYVNASNYWQARVSIGTGIQDNTVFITKVVSGTPTDVASASVTIAWNTVYSMVVTDDGTNIAATINSVTANYSSTIGNTGTKCGFGFFDWQNTYIGEKIVTFVAN